MTCEERDKVKVYDGETGRSARLRGGEHLKDLEKKREKSVLYKHKMSDHPHENVKFKMEITKKFKDALTRQPPPSIPCGCGKKQRRRNLLKVWQTVKLL